MKEKLVIKDAKTRRRLSKLADLLQYVADSIINVINLVFMDAVAGHGRNRKRSARPFVRNYNQTVVYRADEWPPFERVHYVKTRKK